MLDIINTDLSIIFDQFFVGTDVIHALDTAFANNNILLQVPFTIIGIMPYLQTTPFSSTIDYRDNGVLRNIVGSCAELTVVVLAVVAIKIAEGIWFLCYRPQGRSD